MIRISLPLVLLLTLAAVLVPGSARPASKATALTGSVGPGFSISLKDANGNGVTRLAPGAYTITVHDAGTIHNFHLFGPPGSVDMATDIDGTGTFTWNVTLSDGNYTYWCDAHPETMQGTFVVGAAPPPVPKLNGRVGPGRTISLKRPGGGLVKALAAGIYRIAVRDASKKDNFHLIGPGLSKRTGVKARGSRTWKLKLNAGSYTYRSDAHRKLRRRFKVLAPPTP